MSKQLSWILPFVVLELPGLTGGKDCYDSVPVLRLELFGSIDYDEPEWTRAIDGG